MQPALPSKTLSMRTLALAMPLLAVSACGAALWRPVPGAAPDPGREARAGSVHATQHAGTEPPSANLEVTPPSATSATSAKPYDLDARLAQRLVLADLLTLTWSRNPQVREARERAGAAAQGPAQAWRLPDPILRLGWYAEPVQTRTGTQEWMLGITQNLPWPGRLDARADQARARAAAALAHSEVAQWDAAADVAQTYHELVYLHGALEVSAAVEVQARRLVTIAADGRAGRLTRTPELVRAETFLAQLEYDRVGLAELLEVERARLRGLLALDPRLPLGTPLPLVAPRLEVELVELQEAAVQRSPLVARRRAELVAAEAGLGVSRTMRRPDLSLTARTIGTDGYPNISVPDEGRNPFVVELGISLPVWEGANRAAVRQAEHELRAARAALDGAAEELRTKVARAWWRVSNSQRLVELHHEVLLPQAERAARAAEGLFESGDSSFAGLLETVVAWQHFQLAELRARADQGQSLADLERLLGAPFEAPEIAETKVSDDVEGEAAQ